MSTVDTVIFLGAGASASDGAPIQSQLFREYFKHSRKKGPDDPGHDWDRDLVAFFSLFFGIDLDAVNLDVVEFPTFEEILGILEIADSQGESFRDLPGPRLIRDGTSQISHLHDVLVFSIAEILHEKLNTRRTHDKLVESLISKQSLQNTVFISFNYDILIDNALLATQGPEGIDYGVSCANLGRPTNGAVPLFKLHGSLNWLYCSTCRDLEITLREKTMVLLKRGLRRADCTRCGTPLSPIVIPPTFFKVLSNLHLRNIWNQAENSCVQANRLVFCGYSFPDADIHVRYMLKRVERFQQKTPKVFVVNNHPRKSSEEANWEASRYRRFFVDKSVVHYTDISFEDFAADPQVVEDSSRWKS
jgi:NAD-dependent SIR2 family protein deacetylase